MNVDDFFEVFTGGNHNVSTWTPKAIKEFAQDFHNQQLRNAPKTIEQIETIRNIWATKQFPNATDLSSLIKLEEEIQEIRENIQNGIKDPVEYADALSCVFDSASRNGINVSAICNAFEKKTEINMQREWIENGDGTYSHKKINNKQKWV